MDNTFKWDITIIDLKKPDAQRKIENSLQTIDEIFEKISSVHIKDIAYESEIRIERTDFDRTSQFTIFHIVNFTYEISTTIFIDILHAFFTGKLDLKCDVLSITLNRKMQNFMIEICVKGYDHQQNIRVSKELDEHLNKLRVDKYKNSFSISIYPGILDEPSNPKWKLSFKNTKDSVLNALTKMTKDSSKSPVDTKDTVVNTSNN